MPGGGEFLIILLVVLLLFGGKELPKVARTMGKWTSMLRQSMTEVRREFNRIAIEDELKEAKDTVLSVGKEVKEARKDLLKKMTSITDDVADDLKEKSPRSPSSSIENPDQE
ncbi:MAG: twin-arginine translocase TatA/TatE family subunit [Candidatus Electryonea clarkiae]|nr:twin-arginine translocase TatA/TatE family subunit [Candidatus Electryonea clarkiae]MDP8286351.1 twin-arginine translocase TatA/TatE family subunit [Candidatus Electryonea clarkiae]